MTTVFLGHLPDDAWAQKEARKAAARAGMAALRALREAIECRPLEGSERVTMVKALDLLLDALSAEAFNEEARS